MPKQSCFARVPLAPVDPILGLMQAFARDTRAHKVNLGVGIFKDEHLNTPLLEVVKKAQLYLDGAIKNKVYLPIEGDPAYCQEVGRLVFGQELWEQERDRIVACQTLGGTGALALGGTLLHEELPRPVFISSPTWPNHRGVFSHCGLEVSAYPYYNAQTHQIELDQFLQALRSMPKGSVVVLHASCHNPTGADLSVAQWQEVLQLCHKQELIPFFDCAYQGFADGIEDDAYPIRTCVEQGLECLIAVSHSKNFTLYSERVGTLFVVSSDKTYAPALLSRLKQIIRTYYSNPPSHGALIVAHILSDPLLNQAWRCEVDQMRKRLTTMRSSVYQHLRAAFPQRSFEHLRQGKGMFGFLGLSPTHVKQLTEEYGIYMPSDGRINVCGLNHDNIDRVVHALAQVIN